MTIDCCKELFNSRRDCCANPELPLVRKAHYKMSGISWPDTNLERITRSKFVHVLWALSSSKADLAASTCCFRPSISWSSVRSSGKMESVRLVKSLTDLWSSFIFKFFLVSMVLMLQSARFSKAGILSSLICRRTRVRKIHALAILIRRLRFIYPPEPGNARQTSCCGFHQAISLVPHGRMD